MKRVAEAIRAFAGFDPPAWLLEARMSELGLDDGELDERQLQRLADSLRVGETRFFRHRAQVEALRDRLLPERARVSLEGHRPLRAWSAGCATGEEAWTLAMLLDETAIHGEVLATDLSTGALAKARAARYSADRVAEIPVELRARWLEGDTIRPAFHARVRFELHNLLDRRWPSGFDVILCRNVLIYFDADLRREVIARLHRALLPGGYLLLGYSETLRDEDGFQREDGAVYRKAPQQPARAPVAAPAPSGPRPRRATPISIPALVSVKLHGEYHDHQRLEAELKPLLKMEKAVVELDGAQFLGNEAARILARAKKAAHGLELRATRPAIVRWLEKHGLK